MQQFAIKDLYPGQIDIWGAMQTGLRGDALTVCRLPEWTNPQVPAVMKPIINFPSGVRMRFKTDAPRIGLHFLATAIGYQDKAAPPVTFTLEQGATLVGASSEKGNVVILDRMNPDSFELVRGEDDTVWFDVPDPGAPCELWLPHNANIELRALLLDDGFSITPPDKETRPHWVHYGSSISHCMEADEPGYIWPAVAARQAGCALQNFGFGGQCHLDQFVARTIRDCDADLISMKVGINVLNGDTMRERVFPSALHGFLDTIREGKPDTPIMVISPIFCPSGENNPGPSVLGKDGKMTVARRNSVEGRGCLTLTDMRKIISAIVDQRTATGDKNLFYLDGLDLFGAADAADLPDDLHPNPAGYIRMGERFAPHLSALMSNL